MDLNFAPARPYFVVGDGIQGNMILSSSAGGVVIGHVAAEVTCTAEARFSKYGEGQGGGFLAKKVTHQYLKTPPLIVLDARATGGVTLSSVLMQPIVLSFRVKDEMPSTLTERTASYKPPLHSMVTGPMSVTHAVKFTVYGMKGEILKRETFALDIRALNWYHNADKPLKVYHTTVSGSCCFPNLFAFYCVTDRTVYGPGDRIRLSYWYNTNRTSNMPKVVSVVVKLSMLFKSFSPDRYHIDSPGTALCSSAILLENSCAVPSYGEVAHIFVDVPMDVCPDFLLFEDPHPLTYKRELVMILNIDWLTVIMPVPVVFNGRSLGHWAQYPYPVLQKPLPHSTVQAQEFYVSHPNPPAVTDTAVAVAEVVAVAGPAVPMSESAPPSAVDGLMVESSVVGPDSVQLYAGTSYTQVPTNAV